MGLDDAWRDIGTQRNLIFGNLSPGSYVLEVKAGVNNQWSDKITTLKIKIRSPWWLTEYFKGSVLLMIVFCVIAYNRVRTSTLRTRKKELESLVLEKNKEVRSQADELLVQNEELSAQNEQIVQQANELQKTQEKLNKVNFNLEETVEHRTEELRQAYQELDTFFYRSSHDFRRPLTTFMGLAEVAKISLKDPLALDLFEKVNDTARNLDKMIHKLHSISDLSSQHMAFKEIDLKSLAESVLGNYSEEIGNRNIRTTIEVHEKSIVTYPALLKIILENLIENAILFNQEQDPLIIVKSEVRGNELQIKIEDNGQGISREYHDRIFEMYFRACPNSKGNGLGLYIAQKAVRKLGGLISFTSIVDQGSVFVVTIPADNLVG